MHLLLISPISFFLHLAWELQLMVEETSFQNVIVLKFHIKGKSCQKYSSVCTTATTRVLLFSLFIVNLAETPSVLTPPLPLCTYNITNFTWPSSPSWSCSDLCEWFWTLCHLIVYLFSFFRVDRNKYQIHIPLPPKIDPTVTMMQVRFTNFKNN